MEKFLVDTNVLASYFTDREPSQQEKIIPFIEQTGGAGHELILTWHVIGEFVYVMRGVYRVADRMIGAMIEALIGTPGVVFDSGAPIAALLELWPGRIRNYGDAMIASHARYYGVPVITFDKNLKKELKKLGLATVTL